MRLLTVLSMLFTLSTSLSHARGVTIWAYEDLVKDSDVVMIASLFEASKRTGTQELFLSEFARKRGAEGFKVDSVLTKFTVMAVVKGEYDSIYLELHHHAYPEDFGPILNEWGFEWYEKINETFLVFLKRDHSRRLGPTAGYGDLVISFVKMVPDAGQ
ncbi:MAG: hypothetical protein DRQ54_10190, partial [Gammaproteobacteria bacterium]